MRRALVALALLTASACVPGRVRTPPPPGTAPAPDAGPTPDGGVTVAPGPDAGQSPAPDAGDPATPDAGPNPTPDAGTRPDAGMVPTTGARATTPNGHRHIYSQLQAWSSDGLYYLTVDLDTSEGVVFHAGTWEERARLGRIGHRWITGTHSVLMFDDQAGAGAALYAYDLDTGMETELMRLGHPGLRSGRSHEEMDRAGRYVAVYIDEASSGGPRIVTADILNRRVAADVSIAEIGCQYEPDWVGVDPTGTYLLVQSVTSARGRCAGLWAHDIETGQGLHQLTEHRNHGTTGVSAAGRPFFLTTELAHPQDNGSPGIYRYWIDDATSEVVGPPLPWGALEHISCLAEPGEPCIGSGSYEFDSAYAGQIWRLDFDGTRTVLEPADARGCDYWGQPQATAGPGGRYAFATHGGQCGRIHDQVVQ